MTSIIESLPYWYFGIGLAMYITTEIAYQLVTHYLDDFCELSEMDFQEETQFKMLLLNFGQIQPGQRFLIYVFGWLYGVLYLVWLNNKKQ